MNLSPSRRRAACLLLIWGPLAVLGCTSLRDAPDREQLAERLRARTGAPMRIGAGEPAVPEGISVADGLTEDEAVAIALWNNPAFQAELTDLGLARADLVEAGLLRNPILSLLLPWGPKQLEATAKWPVEVIWQRPKRVRAARLTVDAVAERLVAVGLGLIAEAKLAYVDLASARDGAALAASIAGLARRGSDIAQARLRAGDISELEAGASQVEADQAGEAAAQAALDTTLARHRLHQVLGLDSRVPASALEPVPSAEPREPACGALADLERDAMASRPDLRGAELEIEAAAARLGWQRSRIASLVGILDANAEGKEGFELGPGVETDFGLFDRNQGGVGRAHAELDRASARYLLVRQRILRDLHDAYAELGRARAAVAAWQQRIRPRLERQAEQTQKAYDAGELPFYVVVDSTRRLNEGRTRELTAVASMRRAQVRLEESLGRTCGTETGR